MAQLLNSAVIVQKQPRTVHEQIGINLFNKILFLDTKT